MCWCQNIVVAMWTCFFRDNKFSHFLFPKKFGTLKIANMQNLCSGVYFENKTDIILAMRMSVIHIQRVNQGKAREQSMIWHDSCMVSMVPSSGEIIMFMLHYVWVLFCDWTMLACVSVQILTCPGHLKIARWAADPERRRLDWQCIRLGSVYPCDVICELYRCLCR